MPRDFINQSTAAFTPNRICGMTPSTPAANVETIDHSYVEV